MSFMTEIKIYDTGFVSECDGYVFMGAEIKRIIGCSWLSTFDFLNMPTY